jgi:hypothetical protein
MVMKAQSAMQLKLQGNSSQYQWMGPRDRYNMVMTGSALLEVSTWYWGKISYLLYMDSLKLLSRSEDDLENEIKIVKAISKDINMNFVLEKCARICLKKR